MGLIIFAIFLCLAFSLILSKVRSGRGAEWTRLFRIITVVFSASVFTYWFIKKSGVGVTDNFLGLQVINKLPQPLDFYVISIHNSDQAETLNTKHIGKIRPEHYRVEHLTMEESDQYWIAGFLGKKNMVYFSQHSVPNKNIDQIVEVQNYINQSVKLSNAAKKQIDAYNYENMKLGIWMTLDFLLLFLNLVLLFKRKK